MSSKPKPSQNQSSEKATSAGRFAGKVALITGARNKGIGGAIARRMAEEGAKVSLFSRNEPDQLLKRIERRGGHAAWHVGDVRETDDVKHVIKQTMDEFGCLDVLVNNAGIEFFGRFDQLAEDDAQHLVDVNLSGVMKVSQLALPHLTEPGGVIVNVASALGFGGCSGFAVYSATKAGVIGFTQSLAMELAPKGMRVVAVAPALVLSPMSRTYMDAMTEELWRKIQDCHPLGVGLPEDVAAAVAFLASNEARWITGVTLPLGWCSTFRLPTEFYMGPGPASP